MLPLKNQKHSLLWLPASASRVDLRYLLLLPLSLCGLYFQKNTGLHLFMFLFLKYLTLLWPGSILKLEMQEKQTPVPTLPFTLLGVKDACKHFADMEAGVVDVGRQHLGSTVLGGGVCNLKYGDQRCSPWEDVWGSGACTQSAVWPWEPLSWLMTGQLSLSCWPRHPGWLWLQNVFGSWPFRPRAGQKPRVSPVGQATWSLWFQALTFCLQGKEGEQPFVPDIGISEAFAKTGSASRNC